MPTQLRGGDGTNDLISLAGGLENGGADKTISVHPSSPDRVAFSGLYSFVSVDGGDTWTPIAGTWKDSTHWSVDTPHFHVDNHTVLFAPDGPSTERVYVATDGGVFCADDWRDPSTFTSQHNRGLRTLQFYSSCDYHNFLGSVGATPGPRGIVSCGLQDNGNGWKNDD